MSANSEYTYEYTIGRRKNCLRNCRNRTCVAPEMIEGRASEIARGDGRAQPNDLDLSRAREELTGAGPGLEKAPTREEPGRDWGMPLVSTGEKAATVRPEDDENIPQKLTEQGIAEADHDQRSSAS